MLVDNSLVLIRPSQKLVQSCNNSKNIANFMAHLRDMFFCFWYVEAVKCSAQPWFLFSMSEHGNHHGMSHSLQHGCVDVKLGILPVFGINVAAVALKLKSLLDCSKVCVEFSSAV